MLHKPMNYDPIHDTYLGGANQSSPKLAPSVPTPTLVPPPASVPPPPHALQPPRQVLPLVQAFLNLPTASYPYANGSLGIAPPPHMLYNPGQPQLAMPFVYQQMVPGQPLQQVPPQPGTAPPQQRMIYDLARGSKSQQRRQLLELEDQGEMLPSMANLGEISHSPLAVDDDDEDRRKRRKYSNTTIPKSRHLKKLDGEPFWRRDIQYDFLYNLFQDDTKCFTNYFDMLDVPGINNGDKLLFSELYIRTIAELSKCLRVLKERLLRDHAMGMLVAMVTLLVNAGRMNTTINFVPEMRLSLRTFHLIPCLQADPSGGNATTPLQDTPRLKLILKAVCQVDRPSPARDLRELIALPRGEKPNVNVFHLVFMLSQFIGVIPFYDDDQSQPPPYNDFIDFFLNPLIHPANRARRFLWLMYTYMETNFTPEDMARNPFGGAVIPPRKIILQTEAVKFDVDTPAEIAYSQQMYQMRVHYVNEDESNVPVARRSLKLYFKPLSNLTEKKDDDAINDEVLAVATSAMAAADNVNEQTVPILSEPASTQSKDVLTLLHRSGTLTLDPEVTSTEDIPVSEQDVHDAEEFPPSELDHAEADLLNEDDDAEFANAPDPDFEAEDAIPHSLPVIPPEEEVPIDPVIPRRKPVKRKQTKDKSVNDKTQPENLEQQMGPHYSLLSAYPEAWEDLQHFLTHQMEAFGNLLPVPTGIEDQYSSVPQIGDINEDALLTSGQHRELITLTKPFIKEVRTSSKASTASFNKKTTILGAWIYRYFKYKRSIGNMFLGIEWEDIRYDLVHGIEDVLNSQFGKQLHVPPVKAAELKTHEEDHIVPQRDYDRISERDMFVLQLVTHINDWLTKESTKITQPNLIQFDFETSKVKFA